MWQLLIAELRYHAFALVLIMFWSLVFFVVVSPLGFADPQASVGVILIYLLLFCFVNAYRDIVGGMEARHRLHLCLPIKPTDIALMRIIFLLLSWAYFAAMVVVYLLVIDSPWLESTKIWGLVAISGIILTFVPTVYLQTDLNYVLKSPAARFLVALIFIAYALTTWLMIVSLLPIKQEFGPLRNLFFGPLPGFILHLAAVALFYGSVVVFNKRRSFHNRFVVGLNIAAK